MNPNITKDPTPGRTPLNAPTYLWLCVLATLLAYLPVFNNQLVGWDDASYIQFDPPIRGLGWLNLKWMFTNFHAGYWIPLTWFSLALDFSIARLEPWIYHLDNLLLHCANTALVFVVGSKFFRSIPGTAPKAVPAAFGTALLFGLHPLHVESVAWAAERKDLLCGLFFLVSLSVYLDYARQPSLKKYIACLGSLVLALLAKPMAVSLPVIFLLLDGWPLGRLKADPKKILLEKVPFILTVAVTSGIAVLTQFQSGAGWSTSVFPLSYRLMNAAHSLVFYLVKMALPFHLTAFYPLFPEDLHSSETFLFILVVLILSTVFYRNRKKAPYLLVAWLFYVITLLPALGLVQVGNQAAADRFTYLPSLAPFLLFSAIAVHFLSGPRQLLAALTVLLGLSLGWATFNQVSTWKDTITLWENVLRYYPRNNLIVYQNLGRAYEDAGRLEEALSQYNSAIVPGYDFPLAHWGKARIFSAQGRLGDSIQEFKIALAMNPQFPPLHSDLGMVYEKKGMRKEALAEVQEAIRLDANYPEAYKNLGLIYKGRGDWKKALEAFQKAHELDPDDISYLKDLLEAYRKTGQFDKALAFYRDLSDHPRSFVTLNF